MSDVPDFDPWMPWGGRTLEEMWLPFADPNERRMRDIVLGATPEIFEKSLRKLVITRYITRGQCANVYDAILFANYFGSTLNVMITVVWKYAGLYTEDDICAAYEGLIDRLRKFLEYHGCPPHYYAVFENGAKEGYHTHIAVHIPDRIRAEFKEWRAKNAARLCVDPQTISRQMHVHMRRDNHIRSQWAIFKYLMKGLDPRLRRWELKMNPHLPRKTANYYLGVKQRDTGRVAMSRVHIARGLQPAARRKAGYERPYGIDEVPFERRYSDYMYRSPLAIETARALQALTLI
ncbi:hypothetical protein [Xanthobacter autotrophicus]|uniref:hypothetical protein n=1 Tax=Xanthobacter autotrophicus TaxID=280 RepID=UPI003727735E